MAKVECEVEHVDIIVDEATGRTQPGVEATCLRCDHVTQCFGTEEKSVRRALVMMRDECPNGETNFYVDANEE